MGHGFHSKLLEASLVQKGCKRKSESIYQKSLSGKEPLEARPVLGLSTDNLFVSLVQMTRGNSLSDKRLFLSSSMKKQCKPLTKEMLQRTENLQWINLALESEQ